MVCYSQLLRFCFVAFNHLTKHLTLHVLSGKAAMVDTHKCSHASTQIKDARSEIHRGDENAVSDGCGDNDGIMNSYRQAINLIGAFENNSHACYVDCPSNYGMRQPDFSPHLDLSLKRSDPSAFGNQKTEERQTLKHSDASAFSR